MNKKKCVSCGNVKTVEEFYSQKKVNSKGEHYTYYFNECKECIRPKAKEKSRKYRVENEENYKRTIKKYHSKERSKELKRKNSKKYAEQGYFREWQENNPEKVAEYTRKRYLNKRHEISEEEWISCKEYFNYECAYCGIGEDEAEEKYGQKLHREHVDHNGKNDISNCVPACRSCNSKKYTFDMYEWFKKTEFFREDRLQKIYNWLENDHKLIQ